MIEPSPLFSPIRLGPLEAAGRIFKTATAETRASEDGDVTDELVEWYEWLARGGTPLIITGNLYVAPEGKSTYRMCAADTDERIPGLARLVDACHRHGAKVVAQLSHCGRQVIVGHTGFDEAVSASTVRDPVMGARPRALRLDELPSVVDAFAAAAVRCQEAGFDGAQIHAAHGYLLNQFLTPHTNRRADAYGGSFENRLRLVREVVSEARRRVGPDFALLLKLNGDDLLPLREGLRVDENVAIARALVAEGIDGVEVSVGHYESGFPMTAGRFDGFYRELAQRGAGQLMSAPRRFVMDRFDGLLAAISNRLWPGEEGFNLVYARRFKQALTVPVICVGGFRTREAMEKALEEGSVDAISCGRAFIADPYLVEHLRSGEPGPRCDSCNICLARAGTGPVDCWNPEVRAQKEKLLAEKGAA
ncbi:MAG: NADH:flavin oxidoreductase [Deltaproteobacteria bacterium]|jgi:2,4-dienoyl-CoA reductase-like NADH-dependent reductase (Old Yellow Enzyme family)|nr:NADH:flavin oxidoreductase [Deltaproteobacteria bacterium]